MSVKCSVALYMVISSIGEKKLAFGIFRSAAVSKRRIETWRESRYGPLPLRAFAALHNDNCKDAKSPSQELFGAMHHLSGLAEMRQNQTPDKSVSYNMKSHACGLRRGAAPWGRKSRLGTALRRDCRSPFWSAR